MLLKIMEITGFDFGYEILIILLRIAGIGCDLGIYLLYLVGRV